MMGTGTTNRPLALILGALIAALGVGVLFFARSGGGQGGNVPVIGIIVALLVIGAVFAVVKSRG